MSGIRRRKVSGSTARAAARKASEIVGATPSSRRRLAQNAVSITRATSAAAGTPSPAAGSPAAAASAPSAACACAAARTAAG